MPPTHTHTHAALPVCYSCMEDINRLCMANTNRGNTFVPETHPEELRTGLMDGYYDDSVPPGQLGQQHHDLIGCHAVQAGGGLIQ